MPSRFCDQEDPCPLMKKAAVMLLASDWDRKEFETLDSNGHPMNMLQMVINGKGKKQFRVFFEYCPFCGTRIDQKFLEAISRRK